MAESRSNTAPTLDDQLVAYLDGELDASASREIEELLARDADARARLQGLQRAWDALGSLETAEASSRFAETTLEMVATAAAHDVVEAKETAPQRRRSMWLWTLAAVIWAAVFGALLTLVLRPDPDRRLLEHLPILERLDSLSEVGDFKYLRLLHDERLFEDGNASAAAAAGPASPGAAQVVEKP